MYKEEERRNGRRNVTREERRRHGTNSHVITCREERRKVRGQPTSVSRAERGAREASVVAVPRVNDEGKKREKSTTWETTTT